MPNSTVLTTVQKNNVKSSEYWARRLQEIIAFQKKDYVFTSLGKDEKLPLQQGTTTYSIRRPKPLPVSSTGALTPLAEGVTPVALKPEFVKVSATVNQYGNYMDITDVVDDVHFDGIKKTYQPELARLAVEEEDIVIRNSFAEASEYFVGGKTNTSGLTGTDVLTLKDCRKLQLIAKANRRRGHTKYHGKFLVVTHPNVMQDLLDDSALLNNILVPGNENKPTVNGTLVGYKAYDMYFLEAPTAFVKKETGFNAYTSYFLGKDPFLNIKFGSLKWFDTGFKAEKSDPLAQHATIGYRHWLGAKVNDPLAITRVWSRSNYDVAPATSDVQGGLASQV